MQRAVAVIAIGAVIRLLLAAIIPLFPDEAYYWVWSRHLAGGYFDHPYGIAALIRGGAWIGEAWRADAGMALGVRFLPVLAGVVAALATAATARRLGDDRSALTAALVITCMPLAAAGLVLATPDVPLLCFTALTVYCLVRALGEEPGTSEGPRGSLYWWSLGGIALGLAFSSKYTSILLPAGVLIAMLTRRELRTRLTEPGPWLAGVVATIVFAPVLMWNAQHGWLSFVFQIHHGLAANTGSVAVPALKREGDLLGGQAGLVSPILFVLMAWACYRALRSASSVRYLLGVCALVQFGFFVYSALRQHVEPNWPAPAYIAGIVLLATDDFGSTALQWRRWGIGFAAMLSGVTYVQSVVPILPLKPPRDPIARAFGWRELTDSVMAARNRVPASDASRSWIGGDRYQEASELAAHAVDIPDDPVPPPHLATFAVNLAGRSNQYDLWPGFHDVARRGDNLVLALDESAEMHPAAAALAPYFSKVDRGALVQMKRGSGVVGERRIWILTGWNGAWPK